MAALILALALLAPLVQAALLPSTLGGAMDCCKPGAASCHRAHRCSTTGPAWTANASCPAGCGHCGGPLASPSVTPPSHSAGSALALARSRVVALSGERRNRPAVETPLFQRPPPFLL